MIYLREYTHRVFIELANSSGIKFGGTRNAVGARTDRLPQLLRIFPCKLPLVLSGSLWGVADEAEVRVNYYINYRNQE